MNELDKVVSKLTKKDLKQTWIENNLDRKPYMNIDLLFFSERQSNNDEYLHMYESKKYSLMLSSIILEDSQVNLEQYIIDSLITPNLREKITQNIIVKNQLLNISYELTNHKEFPVTLNFYLKTIEPSLINQKLDSALKTLQNKKLSDLIKTDRIRNKKIIFHDEGDPDFYQLYDIMIPFSPRILFLKSESEIRDKLVEKLYYDTISSMDGEYIHILNSNNVEKDVVSLGTVGLKGLDNITLLLHVGIK